MSPALAFVYLIPLLIYKKLLLKRHLHLTLLAFLCFFALFTGKSYGQACSGSTPSFIIDLTGNPDSVWSSPSISRDGQCCGVSNPDQCIEFWVRLDPEAEGIKLSLISGGLPPGALFYKINCGADIRIDSVLCLSGVGPHRITFCKPGNNPNIYEITSIAKPSISDNIIVSEACVGTLFAAGLLESSITWTPIPSTPEYLSYLSCVSGCDTVIVTPSGSYPAFLDVRVCGTVIGGCSQVSFCDTARVTFVSNLDVDIQPKNATVCFGGLNASITANPVGGLAPYHYTWSTGAATQSISVAAGTYFVSMTDSLGCTVARDTVTVTSFSVPIDANAGNDTLVCTKTNQVFLRGSVQAASGGKWKGGSGTFIPNDTTLNATYIPSASETITGTITLRLVTTGNGTCPADSDEVQITIAPTPAPVISGNDTACAFTNEIYTTASLANHFYSWNVTGGNIISVSNQPSATIKWAQAGTGSVSVTVTNLDGCDSTQVMTVQVIGTPQPVISGSDSVCVGTLSAYNTANIAGSSYAWQVTNGSITGAANQPSVSIQWPFAAAAGSLSLTVTNSSGCDTTVAKTVDVNAKPAPVIAGTDSVCAFKSINYTTASIAGSTYLWNITGGAITAGNNTNAITILWGAAGAGNIALTVTNNKGCDSLVNRPVIIHPTPAPVISGPDSTCAFKSYNYSTANAAGSTYQWNITGGTITAGNNTSAITIRWGAAGAGNIALTVTNNKGCDSLVNRPIIIHPTPAPVISGSDSTCAFKSYNYSTANAAGNTYQWNITGGTITAGNNTNAITVLWGAAGAGNVALTVTNNKGCDSLVNRPVIIHPTPAPVISGPDSTCAFKSYNYSTANAAGNTYQWNITGGTITAGNNTNAITILWGAAGAGNVALTVTNNKGCDSLVNRPVIIHPTPTPVISGSDSTCAFKSYNYSTTNAAGNTYLWNITGGSITAGNNTNAITVLWGAAGAGNIALTVTNNKGCDSSVNRPVIIHPTPAPVISGLDSVCAFKSLNYSTANAAGNIYQWNITGGTITAGNNTSAITILWGTAGAGNVALRVTNNKGCDSLVNRSVIIHPTPAPVITGSDSVCAFKSLNYSTANAAGNTYLWNITGGTITAGNNTNAITVLWGAAGAGNVALTVTNNKGCDSSVNRPVIIHPTPAPVITGSDSTCAFKTYNYSTANSAGNTYLWNITGGAITAGNNTSAITIRWGAAGAGNIALTVTNNKGCDSLVNRPVIIHPTPAPVIIGSDSTCAFKSFNYSTANVAGYIYQWNITGGTITAGNNTNAITVLWGAAGAGNIALTVTNNKGCDSTVNRSVIIHPTPAPVISGLDSTCAFKSYNYSTANAAGNIYQWNITGGTITAGNNTSAITIRWGAAGAGNIALTVTNNKGCDSIVNRPVIIHPTPAPVITGSDSTCAFKTYNYSTANGAGNIYQWNITGGTITAGNNTNAITVLWGAAGAGNIALIVTNNKGCDSLVNRPVIIHPTPAPVISGPDSTCAFKSYNYSTANSAGNIYQWNITGGTITAGNNTNAITVLWGAAGAGNIALTVTNNKGCDSLVSRPVIIHPTPAPVISGSDSTCAFKSYNYSTANAVGNTYQWNITGGTITTGNNTSAITIRWGAAGAGNIALTVTNNKGCDSLVNLPVIIHPTPAPVISGLDSVCAFKSLNYSTANIAGNTYQWNITGGTITAGNNTNTITILWGAAGAGNIALTVTNNKGCDSLVNRPVIIHPTPAPVISGSDSTCAFKTYNYSTANDAGNTYQWSITGGTITAGNNTSAITILWGPAGAGNIALTVTNNKGCDSLVNLPVIIHPTPTPVINGLDSTCAFKSFNYTTANIAGSTYQWNITGGTITTGSNTNSIIVLWGAAGAGNIGLTVTSNKGCDSLVNLPVIIHPTPAPVISGSDSVCAFKTLNYSTANAAGNTYQWNVTGGTITAGNNTSAISILWGPAGAGNIALTVTNNKGCDSLVNLPVIIHPTPAPVISGLDSVCAFKSLNYTTAAVAGNTYQWSITGGTITAGNNTSAITILWGAAGAGNIALTVTNNKGCDSIVNLPVIIHPTPAPVISGIDSVCAFKSLNYTTAAIAGSIYQWNITGGTITAGNNTNAVTILWGAAGAGNIALTVTSNKGCDSATAFTVTIHPTPTPVITGPDSVCSFKFFNYTTANIAGHTYQWNITGGTITAGNNTNAVTVLWGAAGAGNIALTVTNNKGCDSLVNLPVIIHPTPAPVINGSDSTCAFKFFNYTTASVAGSTYQWNITGGAITAGNNTNAITVLWGAAGAGNIALTVTSNKGCDSMINRSVIIHPTPAPMIAGIDSVCAFKQVNYSTTNTPGNTYQWNITGGTITAGNNTNAVTILWGAAGAGNVSLTVTNNKGCDSLVNLPVTIHPTPIPLINGSDSVCAFKFFNYTTANIAGYTYQWNVSGGAITTGNNTSAITILWGAAGAGNIALTVTNNKGCDSTVNRPVIIHPTPAPVISGTDSVCAFKSRNYTTATIAGSTYQWNVTGGTITAGNNTNAITILWGTTGLGNIALVVTSNKGCDSSASFAVTIHPTPAPLINGLDSVCAFKSFNYSTANVAGYTYQWNITGGTITAGNNTNTITILWGAAGAGNIALTVTNNKGCDSIVSRPVIIHPTPIPVINGSDSTCAFKTFNYSTANIAGNIYQWNITGGTITAGNNTNAITILWGVAGPGNISLTVTNNKGCDSIVNRPVIIHPTPAPVINGSDSTCSFKTYNYTTANAAGNTYLWNVTGGTITAGNNTNTISVLWGAAGAGNIALTVTNNKGCDSTVSRSIIIHPTPAPIINGPDSVCAFRSADYSMVDSAGYTYQWNVTGGTITAGNNTDTITVSWGSAGVRNIALTVTNNKGCDSTINFPVTVSPIPTPSITGPDTICAQKVYQYLAPFDPQFTYQWTLSNAVLFSQSANSLFIRGVDTGLVTLQLVITNSVTGCDSAISKQVYAKPITIPVITGPDSVCEYSSASYNAASYPLHIYLWSVNGGAFTSAQNGTGVNINWSSHGTGNVLLNLTNPVGCDTTVIKPIEKIATPVPVINGPDTVCEFKNYTYRTPALIGHTYIWQATGGAVAGTNTDTTVSVTWNGSGNGTISLTLTNALNCDSVITIPVTIEPTPVPDITGPDTVCALKVHTFTSTLHANHTYAWTVTGGDTTLTQHNSCDAYWNTAGLFSLQLRTTNASGCDSLITKHVVVLPTPLFQINGPDSICNYDTALYTATNLSNHIYQWSIANGAILGVTNTPQVQVKWFSAGTGVLTLKVTNSVGCDSIVPFNVKINPTPVINISGADTLCANRTYTFKAPIQTGYQYNWTSNAGNITGASNRDSVMLRSAAGNSYANLSITNSFGCDTSTTKNFTVIPTPVVTITGPDTICAFSSHTYQVSNLPSHTYYWTVIGGAAISTNNTNSYTVKFGAGGNVIIRITVANLTGCDTSVSCTLTVRPRPQPAISGNSPVCAPITETYFVAGASFHTFDWSITGGSIESINQNVAKMYFTSPGNATITLKQTSPFGCDTTVTKAIVVNEKPVPTIVGPAILCQHSNAVYQAPNVPGMVYNWQFVATGFNQSFGPSNSVDVQWPVTGNAIVRLKMTNTLTGCDSTVEMAVAIYPKPAPDISGLTTTCIGNAYDYHINYQTPPFNIHKYNWTISGGNIISGQGTAQVLVWWNDYGLRTISVTETDSISGCDSTDQLEVFVDSIPGPLLLPDTFNGCPPLTLLLNHNAPRSDWTYQWRFDNGTTSIQPNPSVTYKQTGTYTLRQIVTNKSNCSDTAYMDVNVYPSPVASFEYIFPDPSRNFCYTGDSILFLNHSVNANDFTWKFTDTTFSRDNLLEIFKTYSHPGTYLVTLIALNEFGCIDSTQQSLLVKVPEDLYVPNAFTPNGDGINDYFSVGFRNLVEFKVLIVNRWGEIIFTSSDQQFKWDGTFQGAPVQADVYVYLIEAKGYHGKRFAVKGNVTLLR